MNQFTRIDSPLGLMLLTSDGDALTGVYFVGQKYEPAPRKDWVQAPRDALFANARTQLSKYFARDPSAFDMPFNLQGTPFQLRVWRALCAIPHGATLSYSALASTIGVPQSVRAVAAAVGRNPISIMVPCHRVIGSDGSLTGYAGGLDRKRALLQIETSAPSNFELRKVTGNAARL
ncbi:MAG: methylated-DNA--[protein]-cysteine S-methyltransferase [Betaproteobacteria bacterium]